MKESAIIVLGAILVLSVLANINENAMEIEKNSQCRLYNEMVQLHKKSGGQYGWPPYKGEWKCNQ